MYKLNIKFTQIRQFIAKTYFAVDNDNDKMIKIKMYINTTAYRVRIIPMSGSRVLSPEFLFRGKIIGDVHNGAPRVVNVSVVAPQVTMFSY